MASIDETGPLIGGLLSQVPDIDPDETGEWVESLDGLIDEKGGPRARYVLLSMLRHARQRNVAIPASLNTPYVNTIAVHDEPYFPGDEALERRYRSWIRWNAAVMVTRAQRPGDRRRRAHLLVRVGRDAAPRWASTTSSAARTTRAAATRSTSRATPPPASTPAPSSRAGCPPHQLDGFRQELSHPGGGLPSYPHPRLAPDLWEFPTVSMGLGPASAIYQAWTNRYLHLRGIKDTSQQDVWAFLGDGEMDEPESRGMLQLAGQQGLDNLTFVVNCNLQRLDGPVRGNGKIIQELEAQFRGAGWNVIKVDLGPRVGRPAQRRQGPRARQPDEHDARRRLPDVPRRERRVHPRALLRPRPADQAARREDDRRRDLGAQARRARLPQDLRRLQGGPRAHGAADGHPGAHHQGLRPGLRASPAATPRTR